MKREILFRGKRVDNREWVEGSFVKTFHNLFIIPMNDETIKAFDIIPVIQETVGQFTGLTDKNSKKIFEGDIVKDWAGIRVIKFEIYDNYQGYDLEPDDIDCEIIGNIYDNPELLNV